MQLDEYVRQVHDQLGASAALADERTQHIAATLAAGADAAVRLAIMNALAAAAQEITTALLDSPDAPTVVVHLDGDEVQVGLTRSAPPEPEPAAARPADDGDTSARISLRLSETLKADIETAAARDQVSVNTWLVRAAGGALNPGWGGPGGWGSRAGAPWAEAHQRRGGNAHRITGWING